MSSFIYLSGVYFSCMHLNAFVLLNKEYQSVYDVFITGSDSDDVAFSGQY